MIIEKLLTKNLKDFLLKENISNYDYNSFITKVNTVNKNPELFWTYNMRLDLMKALK